MAELSVDEVTQVVKDAAYVAIGFGVLAIQKAQVQRRELTSQLSDARGNIDKVAADTVSQWEKLTGTFEDRVKLVEERVNDLEERIESILDDVEAKLPEQAAELVKQARDVAKEARGQVRSLVSRVA